MDRCRCDDYAEAVKHLRFYTVGTLRPDIIDNYDRSGFTVVWMKHGVDYDDMKFSRPKAWVQHPQKKAEAITEETRKKLEMWCPYMTPVKQ